MAREPQQNGQDGLTAEKLAELLSQGGRAMVTANDIDSDVKAGAPALPDGRILLLPYIRWLHVQVVKGAA
jgi:hypothetical protein